MQDEPIVESPSHEQFEQTPENIYNASTDEVTVYSVTEVEADRKVSVDMCKKDEFKEAVKLDEDDSEHENLINVNRPSMRLDISSSVDSHIKSEILREEIDQSIEESPLEVKQIAEELETISSSEDHKCNVYKHIRTEIFTQVLGEDIESGSPERKEISALSSKHDSSLDEELSEEQDINDPTLPDQKVLEKNEETELTSFIKPMSSLDDIKNKHGDLSPQVSEESVCHTDEMSSEGLIVEHDDHLVDYEEALCEHSLTEQLQALASGSTYSGLDADLKAEVEDYKSSAMSSSMSDLELHRRSKDLYSRHDKKDIRSLKSTKQVSTIEEHSSIESCDSPQELIRQEFSEKNILSENYDKKEQLNGVEFHREKLDSSVLLDSIKSEMSENFSSEEIKDISVDGKSVEAEACDKIEDSFKQLDASQKSDRLSRSDSKSSHSKKSDSDDGSKGESGVEYSGKRKEESCSSSGETESPYYSVETSDSGRTPRSTPAASRPCSSEFDINVFSGQGSEYETCVTSQEASGSYVTAISSQEISYATACSSFSHSSRESAYSVDSESSGHLASVEVSSEASETLVPSAQEMELEFAPDLEMPVLDEEPSIEEEMKEPYDMDIPESVIRGGVEMPFMKTWGLKDVSDDKEDQLSKQWPWQFAAESEVLDKFEVLESHDNLTEDQTYSNLPTAKIETVEECSSQVTTATDLTKCFTQVETVSSTHEGPGHRRSYSSVFDIIPDRERVEQPPPPAAIEEEQQSASESSATHSEQTWQTNSVDTAVQLSSQAPASCVINESSSLFSASDSLQETPPEKELTSEQSSSGLQPESYLQLNGPVEVDYNPEYDNPDADNSELNLDHQVPHYEVDGLQFDLEIDGSFNISNGTGAQNGIVSDINSYSNGNETQDANTSAVPNNYAIHPSSEYESHAVGVSSDAEKPEAQQEQSLNFNNYGVRETESLVCPDLTSYLPESDQCDLLSGGDSLPPSYESEVNIPFSESLNSNELLVTESRSQLLPDLHSTDSIERTDVVDTSPEDERYEYKSIRPSGSEKFNEEKDHGTMSSILKCDEGDILAESDYVPPAYSSKYDEPPNTELYTHHEEEEFDFRESDVYPSPIPSIDDDKQSTPSSDLLHSRRFFPRSGDTSAASSLQEFERLEAEIVAGRLSRSSIDSSEKMVITKSGEHDDVSMCSLTEFEKLEKECIDNDNGNNKITEDIILSEIEEGLESQCSDVLEILPESLHEGSDTSEYERRRLDMEEVIKVAQSNVEKFQEETLSDAVTSDECTVLMRVVSDTQDTSEGTKVSSKEECITDAEESEPLPITLETDNTGGHDSSSSGERNYGKGDCMVSSTDSIDPSSSTATHATYQFETDSVMSSSINSAQASGEECTMVSSTDTLEPEPKLTYSHGDITNERIQSTTTESYYSKGSLACKLDELKELETTNGAKEQMEMFLSKLTDESVVMEEFPLHSHSDAVDDSELQMTSDDLLKSCEAAQGFSMSGSCHNCAPNYVVKKIMHCIGTCSYMPCLVILDVNESLMFLYFLICL